MGRLIDSAKSGDKRAMLEVLRDELAESIEKTSSGRDMAALSKRFIEVVDQLEDMEAAKASNINPLKSAQASRGRALGD